MYLVPKNWGEFQHYKDRSPSWIKLHRKLLDDHDFQRLPVASRALAPCLWLLASEYQGGQIPADNSMIAWRLRWDSKELSEAIKPLIENGFFHWEDDDSNVLAECYQDAILETETETETETEKSNMHPAPVEPGAGIRMPTNRYTTAGETFEPTLADVSNWEEIYPDVDVAAALKRMVGWLDANPRKRKTKAGMKNFINAWLGREQDRGGQQKNSGANASQPKPSQSGRDPRRF